MLFRRSISCILLCAAILMLTPLSSNAANGDTKWNTTSYGFTWSVPVAVGNLIIQKGQDGGIFAYNRSTGAEVWSNTDIGASMQSPAIIDGKLYCYGYDDTTEADVLYVLNYSTGQLEQTLTLTNDTATGEAPVALDDIIFITSSASTFNIKAVRTSAPTVALWTKDYSSSQKLMAYNGVLYVLGDAITALNPTTGAEYWSEALPTTDSTVEAMTVYNDSLVLRIDPSFIAEDNEQYVAHYTLASDPTSAPPVFNWDHAVAPNGQWVYACSTSLDGDYILTSDRRGLVQILSRTTGFILWEKSTGTDNNSSALLINGRLYIQEFDSGDSTMGISAYDVATQTRVWRSADIAGVAWRQPILANNTIYVATDHGSGLFAIEDDNSGYWPGTQNNPGLTGSAVAVPPADTAPLVPTTMLLLD